MYGSGVYAGVGAEGRIRQGVFVLTDRRLMVIEGGVSDIPASITGVLGGFLASSGLLGQMFDSLDAFILNITALAAMGFAVSKIFKRKISPKKFKGIASMYLADINNVERASRGLYRNMIKVIASDGRICKLSGMKNKESWHDAIEKIVNKNAG